MGSLPRRVAVRVMGARMAGRDADGMALNATPDTPDTEPAMQHRLSSPAASIALTQGRLEVAGRTQAPAAIAAARKMDCGWYDSSFDLARGLDIVEQDDDALYQLWTLARH